MSQLTFDSCDMSSGKCYSHHYKGQATDVKSSQERILRLAHESGSLSTSVPVTPESSVFVRLDASRMDMMTSLITGPVNTPYSGGTFIFDIYFPPTYPNGPPLVNLETTGKGSIRFNPNLYNTGKVCLSLLGTWTGSQGENWNKDTSTLLQVLVSIQSLIFVPKPYFNEPGYEKQMNTPEGDKQNTAYNQNIREGTVKWAMIDKLKNPTHGYEEVIKSHFYLRQSAIIKEVELWLQEAKDSLHKAHQERLHQLYLQLKQEFAKLKKPE